MGVGTGAVSGRNGCGVRTDPPAHAGELKGGTGPEGMPGEERLRLNCFLRNWISWKPSLNSTRIPGMRDRIILRYMIKRTSDLPLKTERKSRCKR